MIIIFISDKNLKSYSLNINLNLEKLNLNLTKYGKLKRNIRLGIYTYGLKGGGTERLTSLLVNYISQVNIFNIFLFTQKQEDNEFIIPNKVKRINIKNYIIKNFINKIKKNKIEILIYQFPNEKEIKILNNIKNLIVIFYANSCFLYWIYYNYFSFKSIYKEYQNSKYVITLVPFENNYLFKKWGIRSILLDNFITYEFNKIIPSDLSSKAILMIGRGSDKMKRFDLGIKSMEYIIKEINFCEMKIISTLENIEHLRKLIKKLNLEKFIKFVGYTSTPEIYFKNTSLHIFPTISESFGLVLCETKIFGIPNILSGLDYVSVAKGGTIIIYDDKPETISKEAIKILNDKIYRKKLGKEARESMKKFKNESLLKKWIKLIISIYNGENYFQDFKNEIDKVNENNSLNLLKRQIQLLKKRVTKFKNITLKELENFTFMENFKI